MAASTDSGVAAGRAEGMLGIVAVTGALHTGSAPLLSAPLLSAVSIAGSSVAGCASSVLTARSSPIPAVGETPMTELVRTFTESRGGCGFLVAPTE
ncbi:MAG: hypothetical protein JHD12_18855 [Rhodococcus sp.]|nr:hypothetical protein [Rhodococcus sp. (in: high G+C Gram-positive bacteria)]